MTPTEQAEAARKAEELHEWSRYMAAALGGMMAAGHGNWRGPGGAAELAAGFADAALSEYRKRRTSSNEQ